VDLTTFSLVGHIQVPAPPAGLIAHPARPTPWALSPASGSLYELDLRRLIASRRLHVARAAIGMRLAPDAGSLWVLCRDPWQLVRVEVVGLHRSARISLPGEPLDFDLSSDGRWAAISLASPASVLFVDLQTGHVGRPFDFERRAGVVRFRSDGRVVLVGNADQAALSILEVPGGALVVHLPLAMRPERFCFKSDGGQLFLTGSGADAVAIVYPYRTEVAETVLAGRAPAEMAVSTSPDYLFVASPTGGDVSILEIETRRVIALAPVGEGAGGIVVTPDNQYALVLNERSGTLAVIRIAAIVARRARVAPLFTVVPVGPRPTALAVCRL